jgi:hypothetical protein
MTSAIANAAWQQLEISRQGGPELGTDSAQTKCPYVQSPVIIGFMKQLDFVISAFQGNGEGA